MFPALLSALGGVAGSGGAAAAAQGALGPSAMAALAQSAGPTASRLMLPTPPPAPAGPTPPSGLAGLTKSMQPLSDAIGKVQKGFTDLTGAAGKVAGAAGLVTKPFETVVGLMGQFRDSVTALGNQVSQFTALANPALTQRFMMAAEDLTAVIGKMLLPVLEFATAFTRGFADSVSQLAGPVQALIGAGLKPLSDLIPTVSNTLGPVLRSVGTLAALVGSLIGPNLQMIATLTKLTALPIEGALSLVAAAFEATLAPMTVAAKLVGELATAIDRFVTRGIASARRLLGLPAAAGSSVGAAARPASFSSVEEYQKKAITAAFGLGTASADERTASYANQILEWLKTSGAEALKRLPGELAAAIAKALPGGETASSIVAAARDPEEAIASKIEGGIRAARRLEDRIERGWKDLWR